MFKSKRGGRTRTVAVAMTTAIAVGAAGAYATIPGPSGQIDSCYDATSGALRVVDSDTPACNENEKPLSFNQRGERGPTGPRGAAAPTRAYWAKFSPTKLIAASEKPYAVYAYGPYGYNYVAFNGVDLSKCSVNVTIATNEYKYRGLAGNYMNYGNQYVLAYAMDASGQFVPNVPMDVLVNCSDTTFIP